MSRDDPLYATVINLWNIFAEKHGYDKVEKTNSVVRHKILSRSHIDKYFIRNLPDTWAYIHSFCKVNEWGQPLDFYQFMRSTVYLKAMNIEQSINRAKVGGEE